MGWMNLDRLGILGPQKKRYQATKGIYEEVQKPAKAVVVGGGLAGCAAAAVLAERSVDVTLIEKQKFLGGRAAAWTVELADGDELEMERGFHAFFRQYYNLRRFLKRIDPGLHNLVPLKDYPLLGPGGARETFAGLPKTAPFNVLQLVRQTDRLNWSDMVRVNGPAALQMFAYDRDRIYARYDNVTAKAYLDSLNFPRDAREMLFSVFAHSFFNPEDKFSAADLLMMFHFYFIGNPEGLIFDVQNEPFSFGIWNPMKRYLEEKGVRILLSRTVTQLDKRPGGGFKVVLDSAPEPIEGDVTILATDVEPLKQIISDSVNLRENESFARSIQSLDVTAPFAVWRLWLDRKPNPERAPFVGTTGLGELDNISIYERFEGESRRWALRTGGSVIELHAYALKERDLEPAEHEKVIREDFERQLYTLYPELAGAQTIAEQFFVHQDCPSFGPGKSALRPTVETGIDGLALAGDFLRLPFPSALMERAVASGFMAANHVMARWNVRPEEVWTIPDKGFLSGPLARLL
jgi:isorenieratene synthase